MNEIIKILMRRDGLTYDEAKQAYLDCKQELIAALEGENGMDPEEVLEYELGLELDYIFNFI